MKVLCMVLFGIGILTIGVEAYSQHQGVKGQIFWLGGNQMPGPRTETAPTLGIQREVVIYKLTTLQETNQENAPFFTDIRSELVTKVQSKKDGSFKVKLLPGIYSIFIQEQNGLFANTFNANGEINRVEVNPKKFTWVSITVDYEAAF
jgi:hypothetical protein